MNSVLESSELLYFTERGLGPPLLLVHGVMITGKMFEPVIAHFAARYRVIVPDPRRPHPVFNPRNLQNSSTRFREEAILSYGK